MRREPPTTNGSGTAPRDGESLSAWLDGEMEPAEAARLETELARDPALRAELDALESVVRWLREAGPAQAPPGFHRRVMARLDEEHAERPSWWTWLRRPFGLPLEGWAIGLAAAVALLLVLPSRPPPPPEVAAPEETSPAVVKVPAPIEPEAPAPEAAPRPEDAAPAAQRPREGADEVTPRKVAARPVPEVIPGEVTPGDEQAGAVAVGALPPPTVAPAEPEPEGMAEQEPQIQRLVVRSEDERVKRAVLQTCGRVGKVVGSQVATMAAPTEEITCHLPQTRLGELETELRRSGFAVEAIPTDGLVPGTDVAVVITVQLVGG